MSIIREVFHPTLSGYIVGGVVEKVYVVNGYGDLLEAPYKQTTRELIHLDYPAHSKVFVQYKDDTIPRG